MNRLISAAYLVFSALILVIAASARADAPAPGPTISSAQAKSWYAIYTIEKPKKAADKAWNKSRKKLSVEGSIKPKFMDIKIEMEGQHPLTLKSDKEDVQYSPEMIDGTWIDIDKGESGIFRAAYEKQRSAYVIMMGKGDNTHGSYGDYTVMLLRGR